MFFNVDLKPFLAKKPNELRKRGNVGDVLTVIEKIVVFMRDYGTMDYVSDICISYNGGIMSYSLMYVKL